jgi:hypothetical protein
MTKRLAAVLYFLTAVATLSVGLASFDSRRVWVSAIHVRWLASLAILDFAVPTIFLLAAISASWVNDKSRAARWITAAITLVGLMLFSFYYGLGWRPFLEAAGPLVSFVFILSSSVRQASTIAGIGTVIYAVVEGQELILNLQNYWEFGASPQHLVATIMPPILVMSSLALAVTSHIKAQARIARIHLPD